MNSKTYSNTLGIKLQDRGTLAGSIRKCRKLAAKLNQLKNFLIQKLADEVQGSVPDRLLQQAVVEAEALAWSTPFPHLFLPALAEEKVRSARQWASRQQQVLERQRILAGGWQ